LDGSLARLDREAYLQVQRDMEKKLRGSPRIDFDSRWDKQHLLDAGLL
jgi:hypothetical protein